jgi:error-prone DNA polymerase
VTIIGWLVTEKTISTQKGEPMEFVTFEDQTGLYDATLFPNTYRRYCHLLAMNQAYAVTGRVEEQFATVALTVSGLTLLASSLIETDNEPIEDVIG